MIKSTVRKGIVTLFRLDVIPMGASSGADFHWEHMNWAGRSREKAWKQAVVLSQPAIILLLIEKLL